MKQLTDEVFAQVREAFVKAEDCIQAMTDGPHRGDWGSTLDVLEKALAALDTAQPEPLITVESSLRFRLESEKQKSADLLDEVRELKGKLLQAQPVQVNAMLLSEMQIATLINKHFYVGMAPDYSHYKAFALGVLTAAKQAQPERAPLSDEQDRALCEAYYDTASDEYFKVRPQLESDLNRRIFYAGHRYAWINYETAHGIKQGGQQ